ncbi:hypothetical protein [Nocardioides sp.]|uniref:hypothetical protein n=1 Tax=Nocardioides sp. TaxID=35761 RepID=UPI00260A6A40|nr:hypothetical protein [Nocardioides sp.]
MTENPTPAAGEPPTWQPEQAAPTEQVPTAPAPTTAPRPARLVKMWQTVVVGAACLVVGLGVGGVFGGAIGYVVGDHHDGDRGRMSQRGDFGGRGGMGGMGGPMMNQGSGNGSQSTPQAPSASPSS